MSRKKSGQERSRKSLDSLHDLIRSLTPSEKRNFHQYIKGKSKGDPENLKYFKLFEAINKMEVYNAALLGKGGFSGKALRDMKSYLFEEILDSLALTHKTDPTRNHIRTLLNYTELLFDRHQIDAGEIYLNKAMELAKAGEYHHFELEAQWFKYRISNAKNSIPVLEKNVIDIERNVLESLQKERELMECRKIYVKMNALHGKWGYPKDPKTRKLFLDLLKSPFLKNNEKLTTFRAQLFYHWIRASIFSILSELKLAHAELLKMLKEFKANEHFAQIHTGMYVSGTLQLLFNTSQDHADMSALVYVEDLLKHHSKRISTDNLIKLYMGVIQLSSAHPEKAKLNKYNVEINEFLYNTPPEKLKRVFNMFYFIFQYAKLLLMLDKPGEAKRAVGLLMEIGAEEKNSETYLKGKMLYLMVLYDLGELDLLNYAIRNTTLFLQRQKQFHEGEKAFLKMMKKLSLPDSSPEFIREQLMKYRQEMAEHKQDLSVFWTNFTLGTSWWIDKHLKK